MLPITPNVKTQSSSISHASSLNILDAYDETTTSNELLKILSRCNSKAGWTLLIAPDQVFSKSMLDGYNIDVNKLLVLKQKDLINLEHTLDSALSNGNFAAVITWPGILTKKQIEYRSLNHSKTALYCFKDFAQLPLSKLTH
ncbi:MULTISPECIES: SulA-like leucine-rich domain-containing protein [Pseudoalteromonas]|uniref:SulA-like leucine-rich domain-containing protein n=1 Tax=Pseudoalteromonas obscura TaxID=3048491 RepID=A0ABT7ESQ3_9GAMM|nr:MULTISPECIES: SulA-like leucine-rich domain-containing protein [Pseudoalteromonas]MDK2598052.1 SulA-like leucine-rich domain-containing protein [Pseudoalteromonas sp. P94(2023)]